MYIGNIKKQCLCISLCPCVCNWPGCETRSRDGHNVPRTRKESKHKQQQTILKNDRLSRERRNRQTKQRDGHVEQKQYRT